VQAQVQQRQQQGTRDLQVLRRRQQGAARHTDTLPWTQTRGHHTMGTASRPACTQPAAVRVLPA